MHPGWADTPAVRTSMPDFYNKMKNKLRTAEEGADTIVWLAASDATLKVESGKFFLGKQACSKKTTATSPDKYLLHCNIHWKETHARANIKSAHRQFAYHRLNARLIRCTQKNTRCYNGTRLLQLIIENRHLPQIQEFLKTSIDSNVFLNRAWPVILAAFYCCLTCWFSWETAFIAPWPPSFFCMTW